MKVVALAGGTGGAKLAHGLQAVLPPGDLTVIANTGDDTERHGLLVMPDHDAVMQWAESHKNLLARSEIRLLLAFGLALSTRECC